MNTLPALAAVALLSLAAAAPTTRPATAPPGHKLLFADEFSQPGPPDPKLWSYELGMIRNNEAQLYTDRNARVEDGHLVIEAIRQDAKVPGRRDKTARFTSASLVARHSLLYGRVEVRCKVPMAVGTWPAVWMLADSIRTGTPWPLCGEIDIMEHVGHDPDRIHQTVHTKAYNHVADTQKSGITRVDRLDTDFHTYTLDWTPDSIEMSIDGVRRFTFRNEHKTAAEWPFDTPQHLKLNLAVGGDWGGQKGIDENAFPQRFVIDYVRVYQREDAPAKAK